ncbi:MAG: TolC family protein [Dysgonamonadaceae bacterium]|jgi:outer membrane protein|nr:TolC family protein [Dysgonamonadaceae bacterium]
MKKTSIFVLLILACGLGLHAQENAAQKVWTLERCIDHAIRNNINIKQLQVQKEGAEVDVNTAKMNRLPNLNAGIGQNWSFGRAQTSSGLYESQSLSNSSLSVSSSIPIFTGFQISNQIAKSKLDLDAAILQLERAKEDLSLNIASLYLQSLFNKELLKVSEEQLALSILQVQRTKTLVEVGKVPESQLYDIEAQAAKDEVSVIQAKNTLELSLLDLAQSLELERASFFDIEIPVIKNVVEEYMGSVQPPDVIYSSAINVKPVIKEQELRLESSEKSLKIAQSGYYPKLNLNLSYNNSYYYNYTREGDVINPEDPGQSYIWHNESFSNQIKNNGGESIGLSLNIPIFNRFQVRNQVRSAKLNILNQQYVLENTKKTLYKEIQTAYLNATAAQEKFKASARAVAASTESLKYAQERYEVGKSSVFEFNEAKTKLVQSQSEQIQAKYDYIFRTKILDFYNGIPIKL